MRRFVYRPQIKAYVRMEDSNQVVDISDDIISGDITRRINEVSSATLTLQNKFGKYTGGNPGTGDREGILFQPMDRILILASRLGEPFPKFAGYLDEAPLQQLYPGPVTIRASCSLKLLQYTYFDPGLPFVTKFLSQFGLSYDFTTGQIFDDYQRFRQLGSK